MRWLLLALALAGCAPAPAPRTDIELQPVTWWTLAPGIRCWSQPDGRNGCKVEIPRRERGYNGEGTR